LSVEVGVESLIKLQLTTKICSSSTSAQDRFSNTVLRFGQNRNLAFPKTFDLLRLWLC